MNKESFDIIAIGDSAVDAFIKIREASLHCDLRHDDCQICLNYGAKIPYESATEVYATGNASNVAIGCAHLGLSTALVTCLGEDKNGDLSLQKLKTENVGTNFVSQQKEKLTNYHYVLWYEDDRTILTKHENYEYDLPEIGTPHLVYLSSLSSHSDSFHKKINDYLTAHPEVKFAFQPGSVQIKMGTEALTPLYQRADFLICNKQEAQTILKLKTTTPRPSVET